MFIIILVLAYGAYIAGAAAIIAIVGSEMTPECGVYLIVGGFLTLLIVMLNIKAERDGTALFVMRVDKAAAAQELIDVKIDAGREAARIDVTRQDGNKVVTIPVALKLVVGGDGTFSLVVSAAPTAGPATMEQVRGLAKV